MTNKTYIEFTDPPYHINKYLTHWTSSFGILSIIVNSKELKLSRNQTSFPDPTNTVTNSMICFTDTPIRQSLEHCKKYGYFGISFNKEKLIQYGANPVLYLTDNRRNNQDFLNDLYLWRNDESILISWVSSVTQPYNTNPTNPDHYPEFYEREWRISGRVLPYPWLPTAEQSQGSHNEYPFKGNIRRQQNGGDVNNEDFFLQFDPDIIENLIVPTDYGQQAIELIDKNDLDAELLIVSRK